MFIASVCPSVCLKPKFGRLKPKFDDDAEGGSAKRTRTLKTKFGPTFYVFYLTCKKSLIALNTTGSVVRMNLTK